MGTPENARKTAAGLDLKNAALTATAPAAPVGGSGATAGAYDNATNRVWPSSPSIPTGPASEKSKRRFKRRVFSRRNPFKEALCFSRLVLVRSPL